MSTPTIGDVSRQLAREQQRRAAAEEQARRAERQLRARAVPRVKEQRARVIEFTDPRARTGEHVLPPLTPPLVLARDMGHAVVAELRAMTIEARALIRALAGSPEATQATQVQPDGVMDALPDDAQRQLAQLYRKYQQRFGALAAQWSRRMIAGVLSQSTAQLTIGLREQAERMSIQSTLAEPRMQAIVEASAQACVALITRIPKKYLDEVQLAVMSAITTGSGLDKLVPYLTARYKGDARHAHLVALDQVRKVTANVNAARLQTLGVEEYVWIHTGGERYPRELHMKYNGRRFRYDSPPIIDKHTGERGKPGDLINCRCVARPVLQFSKMREKQ